MYDKKINLSPYYAQMVQERLRLNWDACLLSFMFNQLPGNERTKVKLMLEEVRTIYHKLLTRLYRYPKSVLHDQLPMLIAVPDYPVFKSKRALYVNPDINDGLHVHAVITCPHSTRLTTSLPEFLTTWSDSKLVGPERYLAKLHVEPITQTPGRVMDYVMKSEGRRGIISDDTLLLPEASSEYSRRTKYERLQAKSDGAKRRIRPVQ